MEVAGVVVVAVPACAGAVAVPVDAGFENEKAGVDAVGCDDVAVVMVVLAPNTDVAAEPDPNKPPLAGALAGVENPPNAKVAAGAVVVAGTVGVEVPVAPKEKVVAEGCATGVVNALLAAPKVNVLGIGEAVTVLVAGVLVVDAVETGPKAAN